MLFSEKDSLLLRNAELSQKFESLKRSVQQEKQELQQELKGKDAAVAGLEQSINDLQSQINEQHSKVLNLLNVCSQKCFSLPSHIITSCVAQGCIVQHDFFDPQPRGGLA